MTGTRYTLEVNPVIPDSLKRLEELANDLVYSWDRELRGLFYRLDRDLWESCGHSPRVFLRRVSQTRLQQAAEDRVFMEDAHQVLSAYDTYVRAKLYLIWKELSLRRDRPAPYLPRRAEWPDDQG